MDSLDAPSPDDTMYEFERSHQSQIQDYVMRCPATDARDVERNFGWRGTPKAPHKYNFQLLDRDALRTKFHDGSTHINAKNATIAAYMNMAFTNSKVSEAREGARNFERPLKSLFDAKPLAFTQYGLAYTDDRSRSRAKHKISEGVPPTVQDPYTVFPPEEQEKLAKDIVRSTCEELYRDKLSPKAIDRWLSEGVSCGQDDTRSWALATERALAMLESTDPYPSLPYIEVFNSTSELPKPTRWENIKDKTAQLSAKLSSHSHKFTSQLRSKGSSHSSVADMAFTESNSQADLSRYQS